MHKPTMRSIVITIYALSTLFLFACSKQNNTLQPYPSENVEKIQVQNNDKANVNDTLYGEVKLVDIEQFFIQNGYPPFLDIDNGSGRKSMHANGSVIYLYSADNHIVDGITYRYFLNSGTFDGTVLAAGVNAISDVIGMVLSKEVSIENRKRIREAYNRIIDSGDNNKQESIQLGGIDFYFSIEPLSQTLMCSYMTKEY